MDKLFHRQYVVIQLYMAEEYTLQFRPQSVYTGAVLFTDDFLMPFGKQYPHCVDLQWLGNPSGPDSFHLGWFKDSSFKILKIFKEPQFIFLCLCCFLEAYIFLPVGTYNFDACFSPSYISQGVDATVASGVGLATSSQSPCGWRRTRRGTWIVFIKIKIHSCVLAVPYLVVYLASKAISTQSVVLLGCVVYSSRLH